MAGRTAEDPVARSVQLIGIHIEACKVSGAEAGGEGDVGCVAPRRHQNPSKPAVVVASVQVDPFALEEDRMHALKSPGPLLGWRMSPM